jgi:thiol-disulfide isomerase/thioredoxin
VGMSIITFAQQKPNPFEDVKKVLDTLPKKYTILYSYTSWCGGVKDELPKILPILNQYREKFNFIVLADTTNSVYLNAFTLIQPDKYIFINGSYPKRFLSRKESKKAGADFSRAFNVNIKWFASGGLFFIDCQHNLMNNLFSTNREDDLKRILKELKNNCP